MSAYYNEFEPYASQWIRNLMKRNLIPKGCVDERSIRDVSADDLRGFTQCHFFAGLAGWGCALRLAGWPDDREIWTGSPPCQPFSVAGKRAGTADDRHLWPDLFRLIRARRPTVLMGEQVAAAIGMGWVDGVRADLESEGYASRFVSVPACAVNAPHRRDRLWFVAETVDNAASARQSARTPGTMAEGWNGGGRGESERRGGNGWSLADRAKQSEREPQHTNGAESWQDARPNSCGLGGVEGGVMVDDQGQRWREGRAESEFWRGRSTVASTGGPSMGDAQGAGLQSADSGDQIRTNGVEGGRRFADPGSTHGAIPDAYSTERRPSESAGDFFDGNDAGREEKTSGPGASGEGHVPDSDKSSQGEGREQRSREFGGSSGDSEYRNFWHDSEWINGADGKARRVKPGIRLLAHGIPARVGRLRAYGNAIVPQVAAEVIRAYLECSP